MKPETLRKFLQLAVSIAKDAVGAVMEDIPASRQIKLDFQRDIKIVADTKIESLIIEKLLSNSEYPVLAEESGVTRQSKPGINEKDYRWIVDPLDGSLNFSRGIPICCVSIALWDGSNPLLGVIYDFNRNEVFTGIVGSDAWLNDNPIRVSMVSEKSKAVICTGFPVSTSFSDESLREFVKSAQEYKKVRMIGSAALSLAYVSCGRVDCYRENDIKIWDVAAGLALVLASGGSVKFAPSVSENILRVEASNGVLK